MVPLFSRDRFRVPPLPRCAVSSLARPRRSGSTLPPSLSPSAVRSRHGPSNTVPSPSNEPFPCVTEAEQQSSSRAARVVAGCPVPRCCLPLSLSLLRPFSPPPRYVRPNSTAQQHTHIERREGLWSFSPPAPGGLSRLRSLDWPRERGTVCSGRLAGDISVAGLCGAALLP